jgi:hypothetical protein
MADEETRLRDDSVTTQNKKSRSWLLIPIGLLIAFLLGLLPMWWSKSSVAYELEQAKLELRRQQIHNTLSSAAIYARRGEYETARQNASSFFTEMQSELGNTNSAVFNAAQRTQIPSIISGRDDVITLLSRADPASAERLSDIYVTYRSAIGAQP